MVGGDRGYGFGEYVLCAICNLLLQKGLARLSEFDISIT